MATYNMKKKNINTRKTKKRTHSNNAKIHNVNDDEQDRKKKFLFKQ
jgi:hypothetical protein